MALSPWFPRDSVLSKLRQVLGPQGTGLSHQPFPPLHCPTHPINPSSTNRQHLFSLTASGMQNVFKWAQQQIPVMLTTWNTTRVL